MAQYPAPLQGHLHEERVGAFPIFFRAPAQTNIVADPWSYFAEIAYKSKNTVTAQKADAYITQGYEFFQAALSPHFTTRPLLLYYASLNLVKAALLIQGVSLPNAVLHGISDPKVNNTGKLYFQKQVVEAAARKRDCSLVFAEFVTILGGDAQTKQTYKVIDLLSQVPSIHRTFTTIVGSPPRFLPCKIELRVTSGRAKKACARIVLQRNDNDVLLTIDRFRKKLASQVKGIRQVASADSETFWFETEPVSAGTNSFNRALLQIAQALHPIGISTILTASGYRLYIDVTSSNTIPQLAASYAVVFYLGSITRYRPQDFEKLVSGPYGTLITEFLATHPMQFVYALLSHTAAAATLRPYAVF